MSYGESIHQEAIFKANRKRVYEALTDSKQFDKVILEFRNKVDGENFTFALDNRPLASSLLGRASCHRMARPLADRMTGTWKLEGQVMGQAAHQEVRSDWVLNHQFLRLQEKTAASAPTSEHSYEAFWFLGYDAISERYVLHLMDVFGARFSESLGYGTREGNQIRFVLEYGDGPFHTTYRWNPCQNAAEQGQSVDNRRPRR